VRLLSQIGRPIDQPHVADVELVTEPEVEVGDIEEDIAAIVDRELAAVTDITDRVIDGELRTF
jgi:S-adenosylmethionine synthetase